MAVVPGLAERRQGEPGEVSRLVGRLEVPLAEHGAGRIDRVGDVVEDENPDRASPEQARETGEHRPADCDAETERDCEPYRRPEQEGAIDEPRDRVLEKVGRVALLVAALGVDEEPAEVSVEEALELRPDALTVAHVRAVGVPLLVGEGMVLSVIGDPGDHRPLDRGRAERSDHAADHRTGLEAAVGEESVETDRDPEPAGDVDDREDQHVVPVEPTARELPDDEAEHEEGDDREQPGDDPVPGLVLHGLGGRRQGLACCRGLAWRGCRGFHGAGTLHPIPKPFVRLVVRVVLCPPSDSSRKSSAPSRTARSRSSSGTARAFRRPTAAARPSPPTPGTPWPTPSRRRGSSASAAPTSPGQSTSTTWTPSSACSTTGSRRTSVPRPRPG